MRNFKYHLEQDMQLEQNLLLQYQHELATLPPGSLSSYVKNGKRFYTYCYYKHEKGTGKSTLRKRHLRSGDSVFLNQMKRKAFLKKSIVRLKHNLVLQRKLYDTYQPYNIACVLDSLGQAYQDIPFCEVQREDIKNMQASAIAQAIYPDKLQQPTLAGFNVRSKSEALIVNAMVERHIRFVYEQPIAMYNPSGEKIIIRPDFVIHLLYGDILVWDHLGMLGNDSYLEVQMKKIKLYHSNNYVLGQNLILTADDPQGKLDMTAIARQLDMLCAMGAAD